GAGSRHADRTGEGSDRRSAEGTTEGRDDGSESNLRISAAGTGEGAGGACFHEGASAVTWECGSVVPAGACGARSEAVAAASAATGRENCGRQLCALPEQ